MCVKGQCRHTKGRMCESVCAQMSMKKSQGRKKCARTELV